MMRYSIAEIFRSVQGEGFHSGRAASFVRFAGCNLRCHFCDTDHSEKQRLTIPDILRKLEGGPRFVVLTGGEPMLQLDLPLVRALRDAEYVLALETNGTFTVEHLGLDWVTFSPKWRTTVVPSVNELRLCVDSTNIDRLVEQWQDFPADVRYLSPQFNGKMKVQKNIDAVMKKVLANQEWRLAVQMHKLIGVE